MRGRLFVPAILVAGLIGAAAAQQPGPGEAARPAALEKQPEFDQAAAIAALEKAIAGKENEPAGEVFQNVKMMGQMPAGRLLKVMEMGYARSLGVTCTHCHNPAAWDSDEKHEKQVARDMSAMVQEINATLLPRIKNLESEKPIVNCTTCHRGQVKPALSLDAPKEGGGK